MSLQYEGFLICKDSVPLTDKENACKRDTADDQSFGVGVIHFHPLQIWTNLSKIGKSKTAKERTRVVCSRDVQQTNIGSLTDESGWKRMTTMKGLSGSISKQTHSGKSG